MPNYVRSYQKGGTFFFTLVTHNRQNILTTPPVRKALRESIIQIRNEMPFNIIAWCLLPDHLHAIWALPEKDDDYSKRWGRIKAMTTMRLKKEHVITNQQSIWQPRFWEHQIRNDSDLNTHIDYVHINPVKHNLVNTPRDWPYSTFHKFLHTGSYDSNWGENLTFNGEFGE
ncbi:REP-associated tyrosine transposase [Bermanella sp. WJH001]|uniref:REP-associated tyrosine transposase n=1 Tax=Bermanella sp. WJH001 TaxID=3048005 RepID=UPI0024BEF04C|nr:transposase [Bermanella sp. WJH001]MDJ1538402.1 transposase [Bermanella sp. WJH001]